MGRRKWCTLLLAVSLTLLNILLAKFVVRPLKFRHQQARTHVAPNLVRKRPGQVKDMLVFTINDMNPIQHLEEAAKKTATTTAATMVNNANVLSPPVLSQPLFNALEAQPGYGPADGGSSNVNVLNAINPDTAGADNSNNNNNKNIINIAPLKDLEQEDTSELEQMKDKLENLKNTLVNLQTNNQPNVNQQDPQSNNPQVQENNAADQNAVKFMPRPETPRNGVQIPENPQTVQDLNINNNNEDQSGNPSSLLFDTMKGRGLVPPESAAQAPLHDKYSDLISRLSNVGNMQEFNNIVSQNKGAVRDIIGRYMKEQQQRQQQLLQQHQQQQPPLWQNQNFHFLNPLHPAGLNPFQNNPVFPFDKTIANKFYETMFKNIALENGLEGSPDDKKVMDQILKDLQNGQVPMPNFQDMTTAPSAGQQGVMQQKYDFR